MQERVAMVISKPPKTRTTPEIDVLLPWLRKRSDLLRDLERSKCYFTGTSPQFMNKITVAQEYQQKKTREKLEQDEEKDVKRLNCMT